MEENRGGGMPRSFLFYLFLFFSVYMFCVSRAHVAKRVIRGLQATRKTDVVARNVELSISGIIAVKRDTFCLSYPEKKKNLAQQLRTVVGYIYHEFFFSGKYVCVWG